MWDLHAHTNDKLSSSDLATSLNSLIKIVIEDYSVLCGTQRIAMM